MNTLSSSKERIFRIIQKPFIRNVFVVATGTAAAQIITVGFSPLITRLYGPEAFGIQGVFMSIVTIVSPIAALAYPIAIVLPESDDDAKGLMRLSLNIAFFISIFAFCIIAIFEKGLVKLLQIEMVSSYIFLIPFVILFSALYQIIQQWIIRKKEFNLSGKVATIQSFLVNITKAGIGLIKPAAVVLILISTFGSLLYAIMLGIGIRKNLSITDFFNNSLNKSNKRKVLAKRYKDFPLFRAPQIFINAISQSFPVLMLASFFGIASAGYFAIARTVLVLPINLLGQSVYDVFYPYITETIQNGGDVKKLLIKVTLTMGILGFLPFAVIVVFGPWLFSFVFGAEWALAGEYARWLALFLFCGFINRPSVAAIPALGFQRFLLYYEVFSTASKVGVFFLGFYFFKDDVITVALYSIVGIFAYLFLIIWVILFSNKYKREM